MLPWSQSNSPDWEGAARIRPSKAPQCGIPGLAHTSYVQCWPPGGSMIPHQGSKKRKTVTREIPVSGRGGLMTTEPFRSHVSYSHQRAERLSQSQSAQSRARAAAILKDRHVPICCVLRGTQASLRSPSSPLFSKHQCWHWVGHLSGARYCQSSLVKALPSRHYRCRKSPWVAKRLIRGHGTKEWESHHTGSNICLAVPTHTPHQS